MTWMIVGIVDGRWRAGGGGGGGGCTNDSMGEVSSGRGTSGSEHVSHIL
jgi:hypothetical protein